MPHPDWSTLELYVMQEHIEDYNDGLIGRRELLRKVTMITGSLAVTLAVLPALGCNPSVPTAAPSAAATQVPSPTALATAASTDFAIPPAARTTDGVTVKPDDPRITAGAAQVKARDGATLVAYSARPRADGRSAGVLVLHENRGLTEHIKDVVRRVATAGFVGLGVELLSRQGGLDKLGDQYSPELTKQSVDGMVADLAAGLDHLRGQPFVRADALAVTGFCFGGGMAWSLLASGAELRAAAPFYGPIPQSPAGLGSTKAAVSAVYAEQDTRITATSTQIEDLLKKAAKPYKITVYPGVNHAFHNDTGDRYNPDQAQKAWIATIQWFRQYT